VPTPVPYDPAVEVWVRPPALVEAAAGVQAAARFVAESAAGLSCSLAASAAFGAAQESYVAWARAWSDQLDLLVRQTSGLSGAIEATVVDYLRTDAVAAGPR